MKNKFYIGVLAAALGCVILSGCSDTKTYAEYLRDEEMATNWFLAGERVENSVPANGEFEVGPDAPYYKMDNDGYLYMQVINSGKEGSKPQTDDVVYFRFMRKNLVTWYEKGEATWMGNANDMGQTPTKFVFDNSIVSSNQVYGDGIQEPLKYLNYDCEVNLVIRSEKGFQTDKSVCNPYLMNIKYFKAEY